MASYFEIEKRALKKNRVINHSKIEEKAKEKNKITIYFKIEEDVNRTYLKSVFFINK